MNLQTESLRQRPVDGHDNDRAQNAEAPSSKSIWGYTISFVSEAQYYLYTAPCQFVSKTWSDWVAIPVYKKIRDWASLAPISMDAICPQLTDLKRNIDAMDQKHIQEIRDLKQRHHDNGTRGDQLDSELQTLLLSQDKEKGTLNRRLQRQEKCARLCHENTTKFLNQLREKLALKPDESDDERKLQDTLEEARANRKTFQEASNAINYGLLEKTEEYRDLKHRLALMTQATERAAERAAERNTTLKQASYKIREEFEILVKKLNQDIVSLTKQLAIAKAQKTSAECSEKCIYFEKRKVDEKLLLAEKELEKLQSKQAEVLKLNR